jgi:hypothetical protein
MDVQNVHPRQKRGISRIEVEIEIYLCDLNRFQCVRSNRAGLLLRLIFQELTRSASLSSPRMGDQGSSLIKSAEIQPPLGEGCHR